MPRDEVYLLDIVISAKKALRFVEGMTWDNFQGNELVQSAVLHPLEIIGEAARLISESYKESHPEIPWFQMIGMRNRLIHEYFRIQADTVWKTIQEDLPGLIDLIQPLIPPE